MQTNRVIVWPMKFEYQERVFSFTDVSTLFSLVYFLRVGFNFLYLSPLFAVSYVTLHSFLVTPGRTYIRMPGDDWHGFTLKLVLDMPVFILAIQSFHWNIKIFYFVDNFHRNQNLLGHFILACKVAWKSWKIVYFQIFLFYLFLGVRKAHFTLRIIL